MRRKIVYRNRPINVRAVLVAVVVGLAVCIAVTAYLDYVVLDWVIGIGYQPNALYGDCLNAEMLAFGAFGAVLVKFSIPEKRGNTLALIVFLTCLFFVLGNLEDWLYFIVGACFFHHPFPAINTQWAWMPEATGVLWSSLSKRGTRLPRFMDNPQPGCLVDSMAVRSSANNDYWDSQGFENEVLIFLVGDCDV